MLSLIVAYIRAMASKAQKSPKGQKKGQHGKKKAKQPLLGRIVFFLNGIFYCVIACFVCYFVLLHVVVYYGVYSPDLSIK